tara:strand:- start:1323 stop:2162 length:840 start_codon:yes stop_codon:yes gene_type:complete
MNFKRGFNIKPKEITGIGEVIFTDGTNDVVPNQLSCEAYGYTYNSDTGTCVAFEYSTQVQSFFSNVSNNNLGSNNTTERATNNTLINGTENLTKGNNNNCLINGRKQELGNGLNNSAIIAGSFGQALNQGEVVLAGGGFGQRLGMAQTSFIQQSGTTTDATETLLTTQNLNSTHILKVANAVIGFEANVIGVDIGEDTAGDYGYVQVTGAVKFDNSLTSSYYQTTTHIVTSGHSGMNITAKIKDAEAISFSVAVTGIEGKTIQWTADVKLWQNRTLKTF